MQQTRQKAGSRQECNVSSIEVIMPPSHHTNGFEDDPDQETVLCKETLPAPFDIDEWFLRQSKQQQDQNPWNGTVSIMDSPHLVTQCLNLNDMLSYQNTCQAIPELSDQNKLCLRLPMQSAEVGGLPLPVVDLLSYDKSGGLINDYQIPTSVDILSLVRSDDDNSGHVRDSRHQLEKDSAPTIQRKTSDPLVDVDTTKRTNCSCGIQHDVLSVFQANPLVFFDDRDKIFYPSSILSCGQERDMLKQAVRRPNGRGKIDMNFQPLTTDTLSTFLAAEESSLLHISCHGQEGYLAFEDSNHVGKMRPMRSSDIKRWISLGGKHLQFVFVSACFSLTMGQAFVDAGVPHVLCCSLEEKLRDDAAALFSKILYRYLAGGRKDLQESFELAQEETRQAFGENEAKKYCLLPSGGCHKVHLFFQGKPRPCPYKRNNHTNSKKCECMYPPKRDFVDGRQFQQYQIIDAIMHHQYVRVTGPIHSEKEDVMRSVCRYLHDRVSLDIMGWDYMAWFVVCEQGHHPQPWLKDQILNFDPIQDILGLISDDKVQPEIFLQAALSSFNELSAFLCNHEALLIFDATQMTSPKNAQKFKCFAQKLIDSTPSVKIVVLHDLHLDMHEEMLSHCSTQIVIDLLDLETSLSIVEHYLPSEVLCKGNFGFKNPSEFCDFVFESLRSDDQVCCNRNDVIFLDLIGGGSPSRTMVSAQTMTWDKVEDIIAFCQHVRECKEHET